MINSVKPLSFFLGGLLTLLYLTQSIFAQTTTPNPSMTDQITIDGKDVNEASSASTKTIKDLILQKVAQQASESAQTANDPDGLAQLGELRQAIFGEIEKISEISLSIKTKFGNIVIATNDQDLSLYKNDQKVAINTLEIGNYVLVLGNTKVAQKNQLDVLTAFTPQTVRVFTKDPRPQQAFVALGSIKEYSKDQVIIISRENQQEVEIGFSARTIFQDAQAASSSAQLLEKDIAILAVGYKQDDNSLLASLVRSLAEIKSD